MMHYPLIFCFILTALSASPALGESLGGSSEGQLNARTLGSTVWGNSPITQKNFLPGIETRTTLETHLGIGASLRDLNSVLSNKRDRRNANFDSPASVAGSQLILRIRNQTDKQVNDTPAGGLIVPGKELGGGKQSDDPNEKIGVTTNTVVSSFNREYPNHVNSIAGIYEFTNDRAIPKGTAFLIRENFVATAKHVLSGLRNDSETGSALDVAQAITRPNVYLIFNVGYEKYSTIKRGLSSYSPDKDKDAIKLSNSSIAYWHKGADVAIVTIPKNNSRTILGGSTGSLVPGEELVIVGVPTTIDYHLEEDKRFKKNFTILGIPEANADEGPPPMIWFTSGKFIGDEDIYSRRLMLDINSLRGNSGSPVFRAADGKVVGILVDADIARTSPDRRDYNAAANVSSLNDLLGQLVSSLSER